MKKKRVVITGASGGLGRAIAREYAKQGAYLGLIARHVGRLESIKREVEYLGGKAMIFPMDVSSPQEMREAAQAFQKEFGPPDVWINNAMVSVFSPALEMTSEEFQRVTEVTYLGYVYGTLEALKSMKKRDQGIIIQVGSALAYRGIPLQSAYCAAKHAVQGFTESLRSELIHDESKVKLSMVQLPGLNTPHFSWVKSRLKHKPRPIAPLFQPEVAARAILYAAEHYRREWYVGMMTAIVITANKFFSSLGDRYLATQYKKQEYNGLVDPKREDNLFKTVESSYKVHGDFNEEACSKSPFMWLSRHRKWLMIGVVVLIILAFLY